MDIREDQEIRINNIQCRGFVVKDNKILVMYRKKNDEEYYVFPGGHMRQGEQPEDTVIREIEEETTVKCTIQKKAYEITDYAKTNKPQIEYYFVCNYISGTPKLSGEESRRSTQDNFYQPIWIELTQLSNLLLYTAQAKEWAISNLVTSESIKK